MKRYTCLFFLALIYAPGTQAQIITTVAGTGMIGYLGEGGPATDARVVVHDVSVDLSGNIFITARENNRICKIDTAGIITTIAGGGSVLGDGGPATAAQLGVPSWNHLDALGNMYLAQENNQIRMVNSGGIISTIAGTGTAGFSGDGGPATAAMINDPYGITSDSVGNIYFADAYNNRIRKIDHVSGTISTVAGIGPVGLSGGTFSGDGGPATAAALHDPTCVTFGKDGSLYFTDAYNNRVRKIDGSGTITTVAGSGAVGYGAGTFSGDGGAATNAKLNAPFSVTISECGEMFIADANNACVRKVNTSGTISTIAGVPGTSGFSGDGGPATDAKLSLPAGIRLNNTGDLLIASYGNNYLRKVSNVAITPSPGTITGTDTVCPGNTATLIDTVSGGVWSSSNVVISSVSGGGVVTSGLTGRDTIIYTVTVAGCSVKTIFPFTVLSHAECALLEYAPLDRISKVSVMPNPTSSGQINVSISTSWEEEAKIVITNLMGEKVKEITGYTNKTMSIKIDGAAGVYFLSAVTNSGRYNAKIVVGK